MTVLAEPRHAAAPFGRRRLTVLEQRQVGAYRVLCAGEASGAPAPQAGQFYMLSAEQGWGGGEQERPFLGRAFSVLRVGQDGGRRVLEFLLEEVGPGTARLCSLAPGEELSVVGPLGQGFTFPPPPQRALLVGGGVGIAPLAIWQDQLLAAGTEQLALLGFRDSSHAAGGDLLRDARLATDDGSAGHHGLVTELLQAELDRDRNAVVYACGPPPMLEAVRALCHRRAISAQLALEAGMACGFGACFGCVVPTRDGAYARVCVDGPVFPAGLLEAVTGPGHA